MWLVVRVDGTKTFIIYAAALECRARPLLASLAVPALCPGPMATRYPTSEPGPTLAAHTEGWPELVQGLPRTAVDGVWHQIKGSRALGSRDSV